MTDATPRSDHLSWCKQRAADYLNAGDPVQAWASFGSDMSKHEATRDHPALELGMRLILSGFIQTADDMRKWIDGFN